MKSVSVCPHCKWKETQLQIINKTNWKKNNYSHIVCSWTASSSLYITYSSVQNFCIAFSSCNDNNRSRKRERESVWAERKRVEKRSSCRFLIYFHIHICMFKIHSDLISACLSIWSHSLSPCLSLSHSAHRSENEKSSKIISLYHTKQQMAYIYVLQFFFFSFLNNLYVCNAIWINNVYCT